MRRINHEVLLGLGAVLLAILALLFWVPQDTATGIVVHLRGRVAIGDALAPTVAFIIMAASGIMICWSARQSTHSAQLTLKNLLFLGLFITIFSLSLALMRWTGPGLVWLSHLGQSDAPTYRNLRDALPWKYLGFSVGGIFLVTGLMSLTEGRFSTRAVLVGILAVCILIAISGLPFPQILLPPNGDV